MGRATRRRQLSIGAWVVGLLSLAALVVALVSEVEGVQDTVFKWIIVVGAVGYAVLGLPPLLRGTQKGEPLAFEPFRWQLIFTGVFAAFAAVLIIWQLVVDPRDLLRIGFVALMMSGFIGGMYRREGARAEWLGTGRAPRR